MAALDLTGGIAGARWRGTGHVRDEGRVVLAEPLPEAREVEADGGQAVAEVGVRPPMER